MSADRFCGVRSGVCSTHTYIVHGHTHRLIIIEIGILLSVVFLRANQFQSHKSNFDNTHIYVLRVCYLCITHGPGGGPGGGPGWSVEGADVAATGTR